MLIQQRVGFDQQPALRHDELPELHAIHLNGVVHVEPDVILGRCDLIQRIQSAVPAEPHPSVARRRAKIEHRVDRI